MPDVTNFGTLVTNNVNTMNIVGSKNTANAVGSHADLTLSAYSDNGSNELKATLHFTGTKSFTIAPNSSVKNILGPNDDDDAITQPYLEYLLGPGKVFTVPTSLTAWGTPPNNTFNGSLSTLDVYTTDSTNRSGFCLINVPVSDRALQYAEFELIKVGALSGGGANTNTLNFGVGVINKESYLALASTNTNWVTALLLPAGVNGNVGITPQFENGVGSGNSVQVYNATGGSATGEYNLTDFSGSGTLSNWLGQGLKVQIATNMNFGLAGGELEVCWISNNTVVARHKLTGMTYYGIRRYYFMAYITNTGTGGVGPIELRVSPNTGKIGYYLGTISPATEIGLHMLS